MDLRACVEEVGMIMALQADSKEVEFIVSVAPAVPERVRGDPERLRQVLINLASNALKFTHRGEVVVEVSTLGHQSGRSLLYFEVRDTGIGMSPELVARLFRPFTQADASTTRHYGGTGLGLSIVKRLVELMGGAIKVVSEPDVGSTFSFTLPCEPLDPASERADTRPVRTRGRRVLIVDDNETNRRVLCGQLEPAGYKVTAAPSSTEAFSAMESAHQAQRPFDVVIVDEQMPGDCGMTLAARVKSTPTWRARKSSFSPPSTGRRRSGGWRRRGSRGISASPCGAVSSCRASSACSSAAGSSQPDVPRRSSRGACSLRIAARAVTADASWSSRTTP